MASLPRRTLLLGAAAAVTAGCSLTDPVIRGSQAPAPEPSTIAGAPQASTREAAAATLLWGRAAAAEDDASADRLRNLAAAHQAHADRWASPDPVDPPPSAERTPTAAPTPLTGPRSARRLAETQQQIADAGARQILGSTGVTALLWASTAAFAAAGPSLMRGGTVAAGAGVAGAPQPAAPAVAALLGQIYPMIYGYQVALAPLGGDERAAAQGRLNAYTALRSRLVDALASARHDVPAGAAVYQLPFRVADAADSRRLRRTLEAAVLPWFGGWVMAATDEAGARLALSGLRGATVAAASLGGTVPAWPGFSR